MHDAVTWYKITEWDFQTKATRTQSILTCLGFGSPTCVPACVIFYHVTRSCKGPGGRFSKAPETFRARKAIVKSQTLRLQSCEINKF